MASVMVNFFDAIVGLRSPLSLVLLSFSLSIVSGARSAAERQREFGERAAAEKGKRGWSSRTLSAALLSSLQSLRERVNGRESLTVHSLFPSSQKSSFSPRPLRLFPPLLHALDSARKASDAFHLVVAVVVVVPERWCCCRWRSFDVSSLFVEHRFSPVVVDIPRQQQNEKPPRCSFFFFSPLSPVCTASDVELRSREDKRRCSGDSSGRDRCDGGGGGGGSNDRCGQRRRRCSFFFPPDEARSCPRRRARPSRGSRRAAVSRADGTK